MKFDEGLNYCVLNNDVTKSFVSSLGINVIDDFDNIKELDSKQVMFVNLFYGFKENKINSIINEFKEYKKSFVNVTNNIEEVIYADKVIIVLKDKNIICDVDELINHEKLLAELGFGLPFSMEMSKLLKYYKLVDKIYVNEKSLAGVLWN